MPDFDLPAGCSMRITASMESTAIERRRWSVAIIAADSQLKASYGARIIGGQTQKIDTPAIAVDCVCRVLSSFESGGDWLADVAKVSLDVDELTMTFSRPLAEAAPEAGGECTLTFLLNHVVALA